MTNTNQFIHGCTSHAICHDDWSRYLPDISILAFLLRVFKCGQTISIDGRHCGRELIGKKADRIVSRKQEGSNTETRIDQNPKVPIELEKEMEIGSKRGREIGRA